MAENLGRWPSGRGPISRIRLSDGCERDTVPLAVDQWYDFHEFGCHLGNVGLSYWKFNEMGIVSPRWGLLDRLTGKYRGHFMSITQFWNLIYGF